MLFFLVTGDFWGLGGFGLLVSVAMLFVLCFLLLRMKLESNFPLLSTVSSNCLRMSSRDDKTELQVKQPERAASRGIN